MKSHVITMLMRIFFGMQLGFSRVLTIFFAPEVANNILHRDTMYGAS